MDEFHKYIKTYHVTVNDQTLCGFCNQSECDIVGGNDTTSGICRKLHDRKINNSVESLPDVNFGNGIIVTSRESQLI